MSTPHACWKKRKRTTNSSLHSSIACLVSSHESAISFVHVYCTKLRRRARPSRSCRGRSIRTQHERDTTPRPVFFFWQAGAVGAGRRVAQATAAWHFCNTTQNISLMAALDRALSYNHRPHGGVGPGSAPARSSGGMSVLFSVQPRSGAYMPVTHRPPSVAGGRELVPAKPHSPRSIAPRPPRPEQANAGSRTHSAHGPIAKGSPPLPTTKALSPPPKPNHAHKRVHPSDLRRFPGRACNRPLFPARRAQRHAH